MRYALLSDVHANWQALEACLADARERGVDRFVFLGDMVGYGADSARVVDTVAHLVDTEQAIAVRGNHDDAVEGDRTYLNPTARTAIEYAREQLNATQRAWLSALPLLVRDSDACFAHASAHTPERYPYVDSPDAAEKCARAATTAYSFCGHVHDQRLYFAAHASRMTLFRPTPGTSIPTHAHRQWVGIVGSVGQPRDHNPLAAYAIFDRDRRQTTFLRVAYDHLAAADAIRAAGLPDALALRVQHGY